MNILSLFDGLGCARLALDNLGIKVDNYFSSEIDMSFNQPKIIVLIGATASGKTELAIEIAEHLKTHIHNIDSRQIYKFMDIGTAKPSKNQQKKNKTFFDRS